MDPSVTVGSKGGWLERFPAFAHPNYRLWFAGQLVATFGIWMQSTAQGYLVFDLTRSPAYLGYVTFAGGIPIWLFMLYGGVIADRLPRRTVLLMTQVAMSVLGLSLATLTFLGLVQPWHIIVLAFLLGAANAFDAPARQAFVLEMVGRDDLANAISLNATLFNLSTALGPAVAGFVYAAIGPGWCFLVNGLAFAAMIIALLMMKLGPMEERPRRASVLTDLREGLAYVTGEPMVRLLLVLVASISLFGMAAGTLTPAWAVRILGGDATTNGFLQSARGAGALISSVWISSLGRFNYKGKIVTVGTLVMPLALFVFAEARWLPLSLLSLMAFGMAFIPVLNLGNAIVQTAVPDALRGRVMSMWSLMLFGMWPLGGLWAGATAERFGEPSVVIIGAVVTMIVALVVFFRFPRLRQTE